MAFGIDDAIAAGLTVLNKFIPDPDAKIKAEAELRNALLATDTSQNTVNAAEAASSSVFVAGWRPFIGWVCGSIFAFHYMLIPLAEIVTQMTGYKFPNLTFDTSTLTEVLLGMLGMGGLRSFEKMKGVAR